MWDTGPGIPPGERDTIFREFQRLEAPRQSDDGMGLGLTIVERACTLLDHRLELVSNVGRGTGFRVTVPLAADSQVPFEDEVGGREAPGDRPIGLIALVIENDEPVRAAMSALLESWDVSVLDVASADEAVALLDDIGIAPDVILADYHLDGATGLDAIAEIHRRHGPRPAFLITADRTAELAALCRSRQVPLLSKPVAPARLRALLGSVLPSLRPAE